MLRLDKLFSESAVLQRGKKISVWGFGDEGTSVSVSIQGRSASAQVKDGKWTVQLPPLTESQSEELTATDGKNKIVLRNIAVGEVWIASGQSNMEFPLRNVREYWKIKGTSNPSVRLYGVPRISYEGQLEDDDFSEYQIWRPCAPEHLWFYSAAPFYFALKLYEKYQVPIGILNCNYGGTRACSWADLSILQKTGGRVWIDEYEQSVKGLDVEKYTAQYKANPMFKTHSQDHTAMRDKMWKGYSDYEMIYMKARFEKMFKDMPLPVMGPLDCNRPSALYEHMVKKIAPYGARGVIWYQGESDESHADVYDEAMGAVVDSWRGLWKDELPFLMVQLAPYEGFLGFKAKDYVVLREKQESLSRTKDGVYITNVMDCGMPHDIHPKAKKPVGERLALLAMGKVYGDAVVCEAPEVSSCTRSGNQVVITFANCGDGLKKHKADIESLDVTVNGKHPKECKLKVGKESMTLESPSFRRGKEVVIGYGRRNYCECNIKNSAGIPVKPFEIRISKADAAKPE